MTTTFEMTWEDPGPARVGRPGDSHLRQVLAELQKHPGRWAKVAESKANGGQGSWWKKQGCEATTRRDRERGVTATYARWPEPDLDDPRPAGAPDERAERAAQPAPQVPVQEPTAEPVPEPAQVEPAPVPAPAPAATPSKGGRMSNAEADAILEARLEGATLDDLSEQFGRAVATIRSAIHRAEDRRQKAEDTARPTPLVASQPKGTCRVCHAKNRGLTDGVCRLCIIRAREAAARREDAS
ncbi:RNA polymerase sigma factor sigma-70 region 4 domain-containing protein [Micrococcus luteus]|uniref:sigma-70 region 4 domain-containing protein n=1 Tax=Micrococcus luteus TaxID=1270 RepID=UPI00119E276C|nr:sigma-70 region 4 domain-containing protein [Micrococcus luteus]